MRDLTRRFPIGRGLLRREIGAAQAVADVSFDLVAGETLAVVGESGCGESAAGRLLLRLLERTAGSLTLEGVDLLSLDAAALRRARRDMQIIFQDPYGPLNSRMSVREVAAEPLLLHGLASARDVEARGDAVLRMSGLSSFHAARVEMRS